MENPLFIAASTRQPSLTGSLGLTSCPWPPPFSWSLTRFPASRVTGFTAPGSRGCQEARALPEHASHTFRTCIRASLWFVSSKVGEVGAGGGLEETSSVNTALAIRGGNGSLPSLTWGIDFCFAQHSCPSADCCKGASSLQIPLRVLVNIEWDVQSQLTIYEWRGVAL